MRRLTAITKAHYIQAGKAMCTNACGLKYANIPAHPYAWTHACTHTQHTKGM